MEHFPSSNAININPSNIDNSGVTHSVHFEANGVLLFDEFQSIPIEEEYIKDDTFLNKTLDLTCDPNDDDTKTNDSFHICNPINRDNELYFTSGFNDLNLMKLGEYVLREKETWNYAEKAKLKFEKKKLQELSTMMDDLSLSIEKYFPRSVVKAKRKDQAMKKVEKENSSSKDS